MIQNFRNVIYPGQLHHQFQVLLPILSKGEIGMQLASNHLAVLLKALHYLKIKGVEETWRSQDVDVLHMPSSLHYLPRCHRISVWHFLQVPKEI